MTGVDGQTKAATVRVGACVSAGQTHPAPVSAWSRSFIWPSTWGGEWGQCVWWWASIRDTSDRPFLTKEICRRASLRQHLGTSYLRNWIWTVRYTCIDCGFIFCYCITPRTIIAHYYCCIDHLHGQGGECVGHIFIWSHSCMLMWSIEKDDWNHVL